MKPKRFYYVRAPRQKTLHILHGPRIEGNLTDCGRMVTVKWTWAITKDGAKVCKTCEGQA